MADVQFESCKADPYLWMIRVTISDGKLYWQLVLIYNDDIFDIIEDPEWFLHKELGARFTLKENSIGLLTQYIGKKIPK